jgi:hypothetical protein
MAVPAVPGGSAPLGLPPGFSPLNPTGKLPAGAIPLGGAANDNSWGYRHLSKGLSRWPRPIPFGTMPLTEPFIDAFNNTSNALGSANVGSEPGLSGWTFQARDIDCGWGIGDANTFVSQATVDGGSCGVVVSTAGSAFPNDNTTSADTVVGLYKWVNYYSPQFLNWQYADPIGTYTKGEGGVDWDTDAATSGGLAPAPIIVTPLPALVPYVYPSVDPFTAPGPLRWAPSPQRVPFHAVPRLPRIAPNGDPVRGPGPVRNPRRRVRYRPRPGQEVVRDPDTKSRNNPEALPGGRPSQRIVWQHGQATRVQAGVHPLRTPKGRKHFERKFLLRNAAYFAAGAVVNVVGETCDVIEALYAALPFSVRKKYERKLARMGSYDNWIEYLSQSSGSAQNFGGEIGLDRIAGSASYLKEREWGLGCDQQAALAWKHRNEIDWEQAIYNLGYNQVVDWGFGKLGKAAGKLGKQTGMAVGFGTGPAL